VVTHMVAGGPCSALGTHRPALGSLGMCRPPSTIITLHVGEGVHLLVLHTAAAIPDDPTRNEGVKKSAELSYDPSSVACCAAS